MGADWRASSWGPPGRRAGGGRLDGGLVWAGWRGEVEIDKEGGTREGGRQDGKEDRGGSGGEGGGGIGKEE